jgi:hypothetical protein
MSDVLAVHVRLFDGRWIHRGMVGFTVRNERTHELLYSGYCSGYLEAQDRILQWARNNGWTQMDVLGVSPSNMN